MEHRTDREPDGARSGKQDIEALLAAGKAIQFKPQGYSMYPLFIPGRDEAVVAPVEASALRRGDVALYRRDGSILVLHRVWKKREDGFYMVGDNQTEIEGPLRPDQMKGILTGIYRNGRYISTGNLLYRILLGVWLFLRPFRPAISRAAAAAKRVYKKGV